MESFAYIYMLNVIFIWMHGSIFMYGNYRRDGEQKIFYKIDNLESQIKELIHLVKVCNHIPLKKQLHQPHVLWNRPSPTQSLSSHQLSLLIIKEVESLRSTQRK